MSVAHRLQRMSEAEYLAFEAQAADKHEFVAGEIYAMVGASKRHNRIALKLASRLEMASEGGPCRVFGFDVKLRCDSGPAYYYPDVMVGCDASDDDPMVLTRPCLIAEVLSPGTEAIDRREKDLAYRRLPTLREYLLLSQDEARVDVHRRRSPADWEAEMLAGDDILRIACLGIDLPLPALYHGVFD
jgi:Uma2 family endonuclease